MRPFEVDSSNLAGESASKSTNIWSRMLPVMLLLWAMTGAFYPAVDLCAGEKERGTLETLLEQPCRAERNRAGQTADDHGLQHGHGGLEPGERGHDRLA